MLDLQEATEAHYAWLLGEGEPPSNSPSQPDGGVAPDFVLQILKDLAAKVSLGLTPASWMMIEQGQLVGLLSYKTTPQADGSAEIGYGVAPAHMGCGVASRAVAALLPHARKQGLRALVAETAVASVASQRVLEHNNFEQIGRRIDPEDGALIIWRRSLT